MSNEVLNMLAFSWDTNNIPYCTKKGESSCYELDFWFQIQSKIAFYQPYLVSIALQEAVNIDLTSRMNLLGYHLLSLVHLNNKCYLAIYSQLTNVYALQPVIYDKYGVNTVIVLPNNQRWAIVNLIIKDTHDDIIHDVFKKLVFSVPSDYVTIMGTYGFKPENCTNRSGHNCGQPNIFYDQELLEEGIGNEGPQFEATCNLKSNRAPRYEAPLLKVLAVTSPQSTYIQPLMYDVDNSHQVSSKDYRMGKGTWCDRILYGTFQRSFGVKMICEEYARIDAPSTTVRMSSHAIIYALLTFAYN